MSSPHTYITELCSHCGQPVKAKLSDLIRDRLQVVKDHVFDIDEDLTHWIANVERQIDDEEISPRTIAWLNDVISKYELE
jgi:cob(I)alamin adenosyltransferase